MSLRLQINLIITALMVFFASALIGLQIENTRSAVRDEVLGANVVATQLLSRMSWVDGSGGLESAIKYLSRVGRVRANEIVLYGAEGELLYRSPRSS